MPEPLEPTQKTLTDRLLDTPGISSLVAEAEATWRARAVAAGLIDPDAAEAHVADPNDGTARVPGWRTFEDAFPTFYEFTNRPR
jgi:ribosome biogenesis GTPase A